jgi:hypothetical protein
MGIIVNLCGDFVLQRARLGWAPCDAPDFRPG